MSKRDFSRVILPLKKFGAKFKYRSNYKLPIEIYGVKKPNQLDIMKLKDQHNVKVQSCWSLIHKARQLLQKNLETIQKYYLNN